MSRKLLFPVITAAAVFASGCTLPNSANNTSIQVDEEGAVTETIIETRDDDFSEEELTDYINNSIQEYDSDGDPSVTLDSCKVDGNSVHIVMKYNSVEDYSNFNQVTCFLGTIQEAIDAGYDVDQAWYDADGNAATEDDTTQISERKNEWKIFIVSEQIGVRVPDKILYTTSNVTVTGRMTANVDTVMADSSSEESVSTDSSSQDSSSSSDNSVVSDSSVSSESTESVTSTSALTAVAVSSGSVSSASDDSSVSSSSSSTSDVSSESSSASDTSSSSETSSSSSVSSSSGTESSSSASTATSSSSEDDYAKYVTVSDEYAYIIYK
ncbi:MAG: hypothetical protein SOI56_07205 [Eubacteriales bacterium]|jgi:hypothetical protein